MPDVKAYLAGPDVFLPDAAALGRRKQALCRRYGFVGLFPLDAERPAGPHQRQDRAIFAACARLLEQADIGLFNLTPFRGPSADVGTVLELGLMAGLGKPVFGYTASAASLRARVAGAARAADGGWRDPDGNAVEDFDNADNLMIDGVLARPGNGLVRLAAGARLDDLDAFEACLRLARARCEERNPPGP